jgi:hypothetical protein
VPSHPLQIEWRFQGFVLLSNIAAIAGSFLILAIIERIGH